MAIKIYGAFRSDTNLDDSAVTYGTAGTTFQISAYSSLTMTDGADGSIIDGDDVINETPNDPTQTLGGNAIAWDYTIQVTDGTNTYEIGVIDYDLDGDGSFDYPNAEQGYFLAFIGEIPPLNTTLTIGAVVDNGANIDVDTIVPCFVSGTLIETPRGSLVIDTLKKGDEVLTQDHGPESIQWIGSCKLDVRQLSRKPKLRPVCIQAGALGPGLPSRDLRISPQHRMLVRSPIAKRMFSAEEVLLPARKLVGLPGIFIVEDAQEVTYFHMLFRRHEIVTSEGTPSESLFLGRQARQAVGHESFDEILKIFPELRSPHFLPKAARNIPEKGKAIEQFLRRHVKNKKPLVLIK